MSFNDLVKLKDLQKKCNAALPGEPVIKAGEEGLKKVEAVISKLEEDLKPHYAERDKCKAIASGRPGLENAKIILTTLPGKIAELEKILKK